MLDGLTLDQMRVFVTVAEAGSFRAASGRLRRAQSAVSHAIANLEGKLGLQLFVREGLHRPQLTPDGHVLLADACAVLRRVDALKARASGLVQAAEPELRLAVDPMFPTVRVATALAAVQAEHPTTAVRVLTGALGASLQALRDERAILAISISPEIRDPTVQFDALGPVRMFAVAGSDHPLAKRRGPLTDAELADEVQIVVTDPSPVTEGEDFGVFSPSTWRVGDVETKRALILAGVGWGSLVEHLVADDLAAGRLVRIAPAAMGSGGGETNVESFLSWRANATLGPAARHFAKVIAGAHSAHG